MTVMMMMMMMMMIFYDPVCITCSEGPQYAKMLVVVIPMLQEKVR